MLAAPCRSTLLLALRLLQGLGASCFLCLVFFQAGFILIASRPFSVASGLIKCDSNLARRVWPQHAYNLARHRACRIKKEDPADSIAALQRYLAESSAITATSFMPETNP